MNPGHVIEYVINSAMWALLFFSVGYSLGKVDRVLRHVEHDVAELKSKIEGNE